MELNEILRRIRKLRKTTQVQAAKAAGVSESMYQFYEYGKCEPTVRVLIALADFYNVSIDYLVGRTDNPEVNRSSGEEKLHTIKIAARSGKFIEITVTDSELEEIKKQIEAIDDVEDDI